MANEGSKTETLAAESHLFENRHIDATQHQPSSYTAPTAGSEAASWTVHSSTTNGIYSNPPSQYNQHPQPPGRSIQEGQNVSSVAVRDTQATITTISNNLIIHIHSL